MSDRQKLNLALIYSEKNPGLFSDATLLEMGMKSILGLRLETFYTGKTGLNPIDAEQVVYELLSKARTLTFWCSQT